MGPSPYSPTHFFHECGRRKRSRRIAGAVLHGFSPRFFLEGPRSLFVYNVVLWVGHPVKTEPAWLAPWAQQGGWLEMPGGWSHLASLLKVEVKQGEIDLEAEASSSGSDSEDDADGA